MLWSGITCFSVYTLSDYNTIKFPQIYTKCLFNCNNTETCKLIGSLFNTDAIFMNLSKTENDG